MPETPALQSMIEGCITWAENRSFYCPVSFAMNMRTTPMIAIPFAMTSSPFAMIVSPSRKPSCNQFAHTPPMIAIPPDVYKRQVRNAVTEKWSNGQAEGQINRLKTLKRAMYV